MQKEITKELLWTILDYDENTGDLTWKVRDIELFDHLPSNLAKAACDNFNKTRAGKPALNSIAKCGYKVGSVFNRNCYAHRIIWFMFHGEWPKVIDHENGNKLDNRIENLRNVTQRENMRNAAKKVNNKSGGSGITLLKSGKFNVKFHLGSFKSLEEAMEMRKQAEIIMGYGREKA